MASIDERVVAMSFENDKFEAGVGTTMRTLGKLDGAIQNIGKSSGLDQLERNASRVTLAGPMAAVDTLKAKFSTLQAAAAVALGNIATMAAQKIGGIAKGLALDPITQGFQEYATNLSSIQTILANTQDSGGNLQTVNAALQELNKYSDQTIYNFGQMAKNIGTFTAAGVRLGPATKSIKGIANLAALSGSSAEQASTAMYQLSQAIASGHVSLQDWNSVVNAGMGGSVFQKALMRTASAMGTISDNAVKIDKATGKATINGESFRESIQASPGKKSWLTSDVLVQTLGQFTGDLSDAQLAAQGFNDEQIKAIQRTAQTAKKAATEVKTISGVFDVVKESIGSGWASVGTSSRALLASLRICCVRLQKMPGVSSTSPLILVISLFTLIES
jgi:tape measure domain-containing protein